MTHTKVVEVTAGEPIAYCVHCNWIHRGSHQTIIEAWWQHEQDIGEQLQAPLEAIQTHLS